MSMLTLMPRSSGFGSVLRRRNSKSYDMGRRDSFSIYSSYSLPSSPDSLRRYSSYEELGPLVQQMLGTNHLSQPESRLKSRRSSITKLIRRNSVSREADENKKSCDALDLQLARVREQLAQMKSQDLDMTQRVEELSHSVQELCKQHPTATPIPLSTSSRSLRVIRESRLETEIMGEISQDDSESEEDDQSFEEYCRTNIPLIGDRRKSSTTTNTVVPTVEVIIGSVDDKDPKRQCILSRTPYVITQKAYSCPLVENSQPNARADRNTPESVKSESLLFQAPSLSTTPVH